MNKALIAKLIGGTTFALALAACGSGDDNSPPLPPPPPPAPVEPGDVVIVTAGNKLMTFNRATPGAVRTNLSITGLQSGETLHGVDFRPADGLLYGVGSTGRIYEINVTTAAATAKATLGADATDLTAPYTGLTGTSFGVDFNPAADRLRVVSDTGLNLRINVATGATTTDGAINGGAATSAVTASAYTNSFAGTASTTLFAIDSVNSTLYTQNPPNNGTLSVPVTLGVGAASANGFDIDGSTNMGYAIFTVGGARNLYTVNLGASAAATLVGAVGIGEDIRGMAVRAPTAPAAFGLTDDNRLVGFKPLTPNTVDTNVAISGLNAGETLLGIDIRPKDGVMYGLSSLGRIVTLNTTTGAATVKASLAADAADATLPFAAIAGTAFAVDFNPVADRLRVISNLGQNLRINVDTGATTTDGAINGGAGAPVLTAGAYTNSIAGATATMLFDIDTSSDNLALQNPPNDGTLVNIGALGVNVAGDVGFDIGGGANGLILAALRTSAAGPTSIYRVDLATGAATLVNGAATPALSVYGTGAVGLRDIAISLK
ncbi:DUF4394 domain-containing protein [Massilia glaciei]|uniref:DUF4394 domain-containing protein n=1 Tax=Massilia glaciei TaxID=1524097 RepID=A0A2U2I647_9BURK|nr:DUF4394 domain-containing protein [Massilia glaciei]PWF55224.1 DUF4394 domain-containing protein [Massilia glaciei]